MKHAILVTALLCGCGLGLLSSCGPEVEAHLDQATDLLSQGRPADAVQLLEGLDERARSDGRVGLLLARAYGEADRFAEADAVLRRALAADPGDPELVEGLEALEARIYAKAKELAEAEEPLEARRLLDELRERSPDGDSDFHARLGLMYQVIGELAPAEALLREALATDPAHADLVEGLVGVYSQLGLYDRAQKVLETARESGLGDEHTALALGVCLGRQGDLVGAKREFDRAAAAGDDPRQLDYNFALLLTADGRFEEALEKLGPLSEGEDAIPAAKCERARLLLQLHPEDKERVDQALMLAWEVTDDQPENWRAYEVIGDAFYALGDYPAAKGAYTQALQHSMNRVHRIEERYRRNEKALLAMEEAEKAASEGR